MNKTFIDIYEQSKGTGESMNEQKGYSGEFRPDAKLQDFSKDTIIQLWRTSSLVYTIVIIDRTMGEI
jgi:hypothetical protein